MKDIFASVCHIKSRIDFVTGSFPFIPLSVLRCNKTAFFSYFLHFVVPMGISPMGNLGLFPQGKPPATESRYPTLTN